MLNKEVEDCTIFLTVVGSKAYGTDTPESDTDIRGLAIPKDLSYYFGMGLKNFEQKDSWGNEDDKVVYDLRKAFKLFSDNNPNMLELLFVDEKFWITTTPYWLKIIEHRDRFLSKKVKYAYSGYSFSQLNRIKRHRGYLLNPPKKKPERSDFGLPEKKVLDKEDIEAVQWLLANFLKNTVQYMNFSEQARTELDEHANYIGTVQSNLADDVSETQWSIIQKAIDASDEFITFMMKEKSYMNASNDWHAYENWNNTRNDKRRVLEQKFGYDTKHATNLVRLMRMGMEILETGQVKVYRPDKEELKAIRRGAWSYEQVVEYANECEKKLDELYKASHLPHNSDKNFLDNLCQEIVKRYVLK